MSWVLTLLGIVALIVLHELGHFTVAKAVGMRVERFSLFFPPTLLRVRRGETEYAIGAIPAGGYVKITGMSPEELGDADPEISRRAYYNQRPWKRIAVIVAGPGVNLVIAFLLFWAVLFGGNLEGAARIGNLLPEQETVKVSTAIQSVERGTPAAGVLRKGDRILAVDGRRATPASTVRGINAHRCTGGATSEGCRAATPVRLTVRRGARDVTLSVYPRYSRQVEGVPVKRMRVGFGFHAYATPYSALRAAGVALSAMWRTTTDTLTGFARALTETRARHQVSSIIGISQRADESVQAGSGQALVFLGFLSLILAVINLFPFLPLDGGHVLWSLAEKLRGRRISLVAMYRFSSVGIILLLFLVINGVSNDISRLAG
jgi:regulator of sigma E protease